MQTRTGNRPKTPLFIFALLLTTLFAQAAELDIPYTETRLDNGLRVIVHEDPKAPIVAVNVWYHVGSKNEVIGKTGFAHLFEHLMFNGSENFQGEYFEPMAKVGATDMNGTTNKDRTNYFQNVPNTALDLALWMESDRMGHLLGAVNEEGLEIQRGVVQNEKRQGENQPYGKVYATILKNIYPPSHPYSWSTIGSMEDLNAATLDDVKEWFKTWYGPNNAVIAIAGDVDTQKTIALAKKYFGDIPPGPPVAKPGVWIPKLDNPKRAKMEDRVPQARVYLVWPAPEIVHEDIELLDLITSLLASGKNSRLYNRLVYQDQIATSVSAYVDPGEIASTIVISGTAQEGVDLAKIESVMREELQRFLAKGPTKKELRRVQTQFQAGFIRGVERIGGFGGKSDILASNAVYTGHPGNYKTSLKRVENATSKSIQAAAKRWLGGHDFALEVTPYPELKASSESADRSKLPMPTNFPNVRFDNFERSSLSNGIKLVFAKRDAVPTISFNLILDAGYASDQFALPGTSSIALDMMNEGTKKRSAQEISEEIDSLGSGLGTGSQLDTSSVSLNTLSDKLDESLEIFADVILNPVFPQEELDRMKKIRLAGIKREKVTPIPMALRILPELMYGKNHAYSLPLTGSGTEESIAAISRDDLIKYHQTWFKPNKATLIIVGDTTLAEIKPKLEKLFADWTPGDTPQKNIAEVQNNDAERVFILDRPESQQSFIISGVLAPARNNQDELAISTMNSVLGGDFNARINMNLREDKHWAYGAYSFFFGTAAQRPFVTWASVQTDKTAESMVELRKELSEIISTRPATQTELDRVLNKMTLSLPGRWETAAAVGGAIAEIERYGLDDNYWNTYATQLRSLTLEDIQRAAKNIVKPESQVWVVVGDRSKIEDSIRALGYGEIKVLDKL